MKLTYDPRHNIAYLRFHEKTETVETIRVSDELNVDVAPDGRVYGIELLNANEQLRAEDQGKLVVVNSDKGKHAEVMLEGISLPTAKVREKPGKKYGKSSLGSTPDS